MTLKEQITITNDAVDYKNESTACITTKLSLLERNVYWYLSDYDVSGVSGVVIWLRKKS